jgi:hypothetical protein
MADKRDEKEPTFAEVQAASQSEETQEDRAKDARKAGLGDPVKHPYPDHEAPEMTQAPVDPNAGIEVRRYRPNVMRSEAPPKADELTAEERRAGGPVYVVEVDQWGHDEAGKALFKGDLFQPDDLDAKTHDVAFALRTGAVRRAPEHAATYAAQK